MRSEAFRSSLYLVGGERRLGVEAVAAGAVLVRVGGLVHGHLRLQGPDAVLVLHDHRLQLPDLVGELLERFVLRQGHKRVYVASVIVQGEKKLHLN